jgi:hypothetical protein
MTANRLGIFYLFWWFFFGDKVSYTISMTVIAWAVLSAIVAYNHEPVITEKIIAEWRELNWQDGSFPNAEYDLKKGNKESAEFSYKAGLKKVRESEKIKYFFTGEAFIVALKITGWLLLGMVILLIVGGCISSSIYERKKQAVLKEADEYYENRNKEERVRNTRLNSDNNILD